MSLGQSILCFSCLFKENNLKRDASVLCHTHWMKRKYYFVYNGQAEERPIPFCESFSTTCVFYTWKYYLIEFALLLRDVIFEVRWVHTHLPMENQIFPLLPLVWEIDS